VIKCDQTKHDTKFSHFSRLFSILLNSASHSLSSVSFARGLVFGCAMACFRGRLRSRSARFAVLVAAFLLASNVLIAEGSTSASISSHEFFDEEAMVRPLADGKVVFVGNFRQIAPLASRHFETFPKAMAQIARATRVAEAELSFTQGRWDDRKWGRSPVGTKPIGAELWASFHPPPAVNVSSPADVDTATDTSWNTLTSYLGGFFCASLSRLKRSETVVAPQLAFRKWNGASSALTSNQPRRQGSLPSEAVCVENLTPFLKLLPCRDQQGIGSLLKSRTAIFGAPYVSMSTKMETQFVSERNAWDLVLTQTITLVLDTDENGDTVTLSSLLGVRTKCSKGISNACVSARLSRVHAETHAPFKAVAYFVSDSSDDKNTNTKYPVREHTALSPVAPGLNGLVKLKTWDLGELDNKKNLLFDLELTTQEALGKKTMDAPLVGYTPEFSADRFLTGSGNKRGGLSIEVRRNEVNRKKFDTKIWVFQPLPWYVRVFQHTLTVTFDGEEIDTFEGLRWIPSIDRERPSLLEMQLHVSRDVSVVSIAVMFEKAFLRVDEFPPDANRGFDLPPAVVTLPPPVVIRFFRNLQGMDALESPLLDRMEGLVIGGKNEPAEHPEVIYLNGLLITVPTPDFSMPFNVITMVCTLMSLMAGGVLSALTKRPQWDGFKQQKKEQAKRLEELKDKAKKC